MGYWIDVPGYVFMLKPMNSNGGEIVPMVAVGSCPTADFAGTWVTMQDSSTTSNYSTQGLVGTFNYTASTTTGSVGADKYTSAGATTTSSAQSLGALTCSGGVGTFPESGGGTPELYFTNAGGVIVRTHGGGNQQGIAAVPSTALTVSDFAGTYVGLSFDEGDTSRGANGGTRPVSVTLTAGGTGTGAIIDNVETNALSTTQTATLTLSQLSPAVNGALRMTIVGGSTENTVCAAAKAIAGTSQNVIFCAGASGGGGNTKLRSYLLTTKR